MALTTLETISEKIATQRQNDLESILSVSGSAAISRNEYGINVVDSNNVASSLVFKGLTKDKYDNEELVKAVDVEVKELLPNIPTANLDLVPRPLYTEQVNLVEDLRKQVQRLTLTIADLNTQITTLQAQVQTEINNRLSIEQTNDLLVNQIETLNATIEDFTSQISTSLQKSVDESILRASLQSQKTGFKAQIEALIQQINSLNAIIEGLQSQLGAVRQQKDLEQTAQSQGGTIINKIVTANFLAKGSANDPVMAYKIKNARDRAKEWVYGKNLKLINNDLEPVTVTLTTKFRAESISTFLNEYKSDQAWFKAPKESFKITAGSTEEITFIETPEKIIFAKRQNTEFFDGVLNIKVTRADGTSDSRDFKTRLKIAHPKSYEGF
jgi:predicted  nucleic acid-binding Zn-ribbon protein